jgi:hypothetical protein
MPTWLQITLPILTALLGGTVGFGFGRLGKVMDRRQERKEAEAAKAPDFMITHVDGVLYRLINDGDVDASGVRFDLSGVPDYQVREAPEGVRIPIRDGHEFSIMSADELPLPSRLLVVCDQLSEPVAVRVPL